MKKLTGICLLSMTLTLVACGGGGTPTPPVVTVPTVNFTVTAPLSVSTTQGGTAAVQVRLNTSSALPDGVTFTTIAPEGLTVSKSNIVPNQDTTLSFSAIDGLGIGKYVVTLNFKSGTIERSINIDVNVDKKLIGSSYKSFGTNGSVFLGVPDSRNTAVTAALDKKNRIITVSQVTDSNGTKKRFVMTRMSWDGAVDAAFAGPGYAVVPALDNLDGILRVIITPKDKILLVAMYGGRPVLYRFNSDGNLDATYGNKGAFIIYDYSSILDFQVNSVAVSRDGSIALLNSFVEQDGFDSRIVKFDAEGETDTNFGYGGQLLLKLEKLVAHFAQVNFQSNGKMLIARSMSNGSNLDYAVTRLHADGSKDLTFGEDGTILIDRNATDQNVYGFTIDSSDEIRLLGRSGITSEVLKIRIDGHVAIDYGSGGFVTLPSLFSADSMIINNSNIVLYNDRFQGAILDAKGQLSEIKFDMPAGSSAVLNRLEALGDRIIALGSVEAGTKAIVSSYAR